MLKLAMSPDNERRFLNKPQHAPLLHALPHAPKPETLVLFFICVFVCKNTDSSELSVARPVIAHAAPRTQDFHFCKITIPRSSRRCSSESTRSYRPPVRSNSSAASTGIGVVGSNLNFPKGVLFFKTKKFFTIRIY